MDHNDKTFCCAPRESIEKNKEEMEAGFSEVAEKQRQNEQTHTTIKTDLENFQTQTKAIQNLILILDSDF